jgi:hypothetical protein
VAGIGWALSQITASGFSGKNATKYVRIELDKRPERDAVNPKVKSSNEYR